jgi:hypothetical protein
MDRPEQPRWFPGVLAAAVPLRDGQLRRLAHTRPLDLDAVVDAGTDPDRPRAAPGVGVAVTIHYALWAMVIAVDLLAVQCGKLPSCYNQRWLGWFDAIRERLADPAALMVTFTAVPLLLIGLLWLLGRRNARLYDRYWADTDCADDSGDPEFGLVDDLQLRQTDFWRAASFVQIQALLHATAAVAAVGAALAWTLTRTGSPTPAAPAWSGWGGSAGAWPPSPGWRWPPPRRPGCSPTGGPPPAIPIRRGSGWAASCWASRWGWWPPWDGSAGQRRSLPRCRCQACAMPSAASWWPSCWCCWCCVHWSSCGWVAPSCSPGSCCSTRWSGTIHGRCGGRGCCSRWPLPPSPWPSTLEGPLVTILGWRAEQASWPKRIAIALVAILYLMGALARPSRRGCAAQLRLPRRRRRPPVRQPRRPDHPAPPDPSTPRVTYVRPRAGRDRLDRHPALRKVTLDRPCSSPEHPGPRSYPVAVPGDDA